MCQCLHQFYHDMAWHLSTTTYYWICRDSATLILNFKPHNKGQTRVRISGKKYRPGSGKWYQILGAESATLSTVHTSTQYMNLFFYTKTVTGTPPPPCWKSLFPSFWNELYDPSIYSRIVWQRMYGVRIPTATNLHRFFLWPQWNYCWIGVMVYSTPGKGTMRSFSLVLYSG